MDAYGLSTRLAPHTALQLYITFTPTNDEGVFVFGDQSRGNHLGYVLAMGSSSWFMISATTTLLTFVSYSLHTAHLRPTALMDPLIRTWGFQPLSP